MIVMSQIKAGHRACGEPLLRKGRNEFDGKKLTRSERAFLDALVQAKIVQVIEEDPPAKVIPLPVVRPDLDPVEPEPPMKRRRMRASDAREPAVAPEKKPEVAPKKRANAKRRKRTAKTPKDDDAKNRKAG